MKLIPHRTEWAQHFAAEKRRLYKTLKPLNTGIEHIGSTSVPGLAAKPIVDIMLGATTPEDVLLIDDMLQTIGYESHGEKGVPGRLFFTFGDPCLFHLHLVVREGVIWTGHLAFRDALIANPSLAADYVSVKTRLAYEFPLDRESYTLGKADFIEKVLKK